MSVLSRPTGTRSVSVGGVIMTAREYKALILKRPYRAKTQVIARCHWEDPLHWVYFDIQDNEQLPIGGPNDGDMEIVLRVSP